MNHKLKQLKQPVDEMAVAAERLAQQIHRFQNYMLTQPMIEAMRANLAIVSDQLAELEPMLDDLQEDNDG